jgi:high-affinity iron transporter
MDIVRRLAALLLLVAATGVIDSAAYAATPAQEVQTTWRLLDYIAVDYREAVREGKIVNPAEYQEMAEF